jgi:glycosyltransferase involved in cell wall biosynthesis
MRSPLVSVLMPTMNTGQYVAEAVESILSQTLSDFERLVVDGGSTDGTQEVLP